METARKLITEGVYDNLEFFTTYAFENGEDAEYFGVELFKETGKFVKGCYINASIKLYLHYRDTSDEREAFAWEKVLFGIRLLKNDVVATWGKLNVMRGVYSLFRRGLLSMLPDDCIEILRDRTSIDDFYDREKKALIGRFPSNYYQVAMATEAFREMVGWENSGESDIIKDKLLGIMKDFSGGGWMDECPPFGRYDRYSILISSELIDSLNSIGKEIPEFALKNLSDAAKLALECANPNGDGIIYGRSLSVHGDCAFLEILATALRCGLIKDEDKQLAMSYCGAILRHTFSYWFDKNRNSYNLWFDGRTTNGYRHIQRLLDVNLDMAIHMLTTLENLEAAGCADMPTDIPLPENPHDFTNPSKTVFSDRPDEKRILYSFVQDGKLYQLPLICSALCSAAYQPFPASVCRIEAPPETMLPFLVPRFWNESDMFYTPVGFYTDISEEAAEVDGCCGTCITAKGKMCLFGKNRFEKSDIDFTAKYTFAGKKILMSYTADTDIQMTCRAMYAYGKDGCKVTFNGETPEVIPVSGDSRYFTPHGESIGAMEYTAKTNRVDIVLEL